MLALSPQLVLQPAARPFTVPCHGEHCNHRDPLPAGDFNAFTTRLEKPEWPEQTQCESLSRRHLYRISPRAKGEDSSFHTAITFFSRVPNPLFANGGRDACESGLPTEMDRLLRQQDAGMKKRTSAAFDRRGRSGRSTSQHPGRCIAGRKYRRARRGGKRSFHDSRAVSMKSSAPVEAIVRGSFA
jgi:hypothetical protein